MIEHATIDGREADVAYLMSDFTLGTPDHYDLIKVLFKDGEVLFLSGSVAPADAKLNTQHEKAFVDLELGTATFTLEVARTPDQQARGLKERDALAPFGGMLFEFDPPRNVVVTMKDVRFALDVVFVDEGGEVIEVLRNLQPGNTLYRSKAPAAAMIEVAAGFARDLDVGDSVAVVKSYYNEDQARDDHGRWSDGAGGVGGVSGLPSNADLSTRDMEAVRQAIGRGVWDLKVTDKRESGANTTYVVSVTPKEIPADWKEAGDGKWYDPTHATVDADGFVTYNGSDPQRLAGKDGLIERNAEGALYRGMSYEEFTAARDAGKYQSAGDYNLAEGKPGIGDAAHTYFSTDAQQAESYAHGFAPWPFAATPDRPAVVVRVDGVTGSVPPHESPSSTERRVEGAVPFTTTKEVYVARPWYVKSGTVDIVVNKETGKASEGSRFSPSIGVYWQKADMAAKFTVRDFFDENQPRDDKGRWAAGAGSGGSDSDQMGHDGGGSGGYAPTSSYTPPSDEQQKAASEQLKSTVQQMADLYARTGVATGISEAHEDDNVSIPKFVMDHGSVFPIGPDSYAGERCTAKQCYANAGREAIANDKVAYVEGYVQLGDKDGAPVAFPIEHAFLVDRESGYVVDPTLRVGSTTYKPIAYFGVPFKSDYLSKTVTKSKTWGLYGGWNLKLLTDKGVAEKAVDTSVKPAKTFRAYYSPDQARDDHGRWAGDGASGGAGKITEFKPTTQTGDPLDPGRLEASVKYVLGDNVDIHAIANEMVAKIPTDEKFIASLRPGFGEITVGLVGDKGTRISRTFTRDEKENLTVYHDHFELPPDAQGKGVAKAVIGASVDMYERLGVSRVDLFANLDAGAYAWARMGFVPRDNTESWVPNATKRIDGLVKRGDIPNDLGNKLAVALMRGPKGIWAVADARYGSINIGKVALKGLDWSGSLDMKDPEQMARIKRYVQ